MSYGRIAFGRLGVWAVSLGLALGGCSPPVAPNNGNDNGGVDTGTNPSARKTISLKAPEIGVPEEEARYSWVQVAGPPVELILADPQAPTFTLPASVTEATEFGFVVEITTGDVTRPYAVSAKVNPSPTRLGNRPPVAVAGEFKIARIGETVVLNAGNSYDPDDDALTFDWQQVAFADAASAPRRLELLDADRPGAYFTADFSGTLLFMVEVSDGQFTVSHTMAVAVLGEGLCADTACIPGFVCDPATGECAPENEDDDDGRCAGADCGEGFACDPATGDCVRIDLCDGVDCGEGFTCDPDTGDCVTEDEEEDEVIPVADAGEDQDVLVGDSVWLDGAGSFDPQGLDLEFLWTQVSGPSVELSDADTAAPMFIAPEVEEPTELIFELIVANQESFSNPDTVTIHVAPAPTDAQVFAQWSNASNDVNVDVFWWQPSGVVEVARMGYGASGIESVRLPFELVEEGTHFLSLEFAGQGRYADLDYEVRIGAYAYHFAARIQGSFRRVIMLDVHDGVVTPLFNSWVDAAEPQAAGVTDRHAVDIVAGWRSASNDVHIDVNLVMPDGSWAEPFRHGYAREGVERIYLPEDLALADGNYELSISLSGTSRYADVNAIVSILGYRFELTERLVGSKTWVMGFDVTDGQATPVFNGWMDMGAEDACQVSGLHDLEIVGGWREASEEMHMDIHVQRPDGTWMEAWRSGFAYQGYERIFQPAETAVEDGLYTIVVGLIGTNRYADVDFHATLLDWSFDDQRRLAGTNTYQFQVEVVDGVATEIGNTWPE